MTGSEERFIEDDISTDLGEGGILQRCENC